MVNSRSSVGSEVIKKIAEEGRVKTHIKKPPESSPPTRLFTTRALSRGTRSTK
jgi:hypothetical protein